MNQARKTALKRSLLNNGYKSNHETGHDLRVYTRLICQPTDLKLASHSIDLEYEEKPESN